MKPNTVEAMRNLIRQVREAMPFDLPGSRACDGPCDGCSVKLLAFLESQLEDWECRLDAGEKPGLGEVSSLARTSRKVHRVLVRNGLIPDSGVDR